MRQARLVRIAKVLHVPVAALLAGMDDPKRPDAALPGALLSARTPLRLATAFAAIDDKKSARAVQRSLMQLTEHIARLVPRRGGRG
jgi:hypothetical protein